MCVGEIAGSVFLNGDVLLSASDEEEKKILRPSSNGAKKGISNKTAKY